MDDFLSEAMGHASRSNFTPFFHQVLFGLKSNALWFPMLDRGFMIVDGKTKSKRRIFSNVQCGNGNPLVGVGIIIGVHDFVDGRIQCWMMLLEEVFNSTA